MWLDTRAQSVGRSIQTNLEGFPRTWNIHRGRVRTETGTALCLLLLRRSGGGWGFLWSGTLTLGTSGHHAAMMRSVSQANGEHEEIAPARRKDVTCGRCGAGVPITCNRSTRCRDAVAWSRLPKFFRSSKFQRRHANCSQRMVGVTLLRCGWELRVSGRSLECVKGREAQGSST